MADIIASSLKTYLETLTATHDVCDALGTRLVFGANLFIGVEPEITNCVTIIPYGGAPPSPEGDRQFAALQLRTKTSTAKKSLNIGQGLINLLHNNDSACSGRINAVQSAPIIIGFTEGGENIITVTNFIVKHVKL